VGASKNIASDISSGARETLYTTGVGFWLVFHPDIAAIINDHSVGAFLQTGFQFKDQLA
jgi:hypothetical protein